MTTEKKSSPLASQSTTQSPDESTSESPCKATTTPESWQSWRENGLIIVSAIILAIAIRLFVAEPRFIPSGSMLPTLESGDRVVVEKISYRYRTPQSGEIVVFHPPVQLQLQGYGPDQAFIKRVIGTPDHEIAVRDRQVYVDNQPLAEDYILAPPNYQLNPVRVPKQQIFLMGDNRNNSNDSHIWGFLPETNVIGRAVFRFWPLNRIGLL